MVAQYPHILKYVIETDSETSTNENGDTIIIPGTTTTVELKCRFEPNSKGQTIVANDGKLLVYNWMIYMPLGQPDVPNKIEIEVFDSLGQIKGKGTVERFDRGQLNARAWV